MERRKAYWIHDERHLQQQIYLARNIISASQNPYLLPPERLLDFICAIRSSSSALLSLALAMSVDN